MHGISMNPKIKNLNWLFLSVFIVIIDQITKFLITKYLFDAQAIAVFPFLNLTLQHNPGAAFSFLSAASGWQRWLFTGIAISVSILIIVWIYQLKLKDYGNAIGLSLVLGGALGNLIDRIFHGYVIDFIQVYYQQWSFPVFNVADSAITIGAVFIIFRMLWPKGKE